MPFSETEGNSTSLHHSQSDDREWAPVCLPSHRRRHHRSLRLRAQEARAESHRNLTPMPFGKLPPGHVPKVRPCRRAGYAPSAVLPELVGLSLDWLERAPGPQDRALFLSP
jgi:hypothetical protein